MHKYQFLKIITALNVLISLGFSIAGIINPAWIVPSPALNDTSAKIFAMYAASRSIPIAVLAIIAIFKGKDEQRIVTLAVVAGYIQLIDGCIGVYLHEPSKTFGPFILAAATALAIYQVKNKKGQNN